MLLHHLGGLLECLKITGCMGVIKLTTCIRKTKIWSVSWNRTVKLLKYRFTRKIVCSRWHKLLAWRKFFFIVIKLNANHASCLKVVLVLSYTFSWSLKLVLLRFVEPFVIFSFWMMFQNQLFLHRLTSLRSWVVVHSPIVNFVEVTWICLTKLRRLVIHFQRFYCASNSNWIIHMKFLVTHTVPNRVT